MVTVNAMCMNQPARRAAIITLYRMEGQEGITPRMAPRKPNSFEEHLQHTLRPTANPTPTNTGNLRFRPLPRHADTVWGSNTSARRRPFFPSSDVSAPQGLCNAAPKRKTMRTKQANPLPASRELCCPDGGMPAQHLFESCAEQRLGQLLRAGWCSSLEASKLPPLPHRRARVKLHWPNACCVLDGRAHLLKRVCRKLGAHIISMRVSRSRVPTARSCRSIHSQRLSPLSAACECAETCSASSARVEVTALGATRSVAGGAASPQRPHAFCING